MDVSGRRMIKTACVFSAIITISLFLSSCGGDHSFHEEGRAASLEVKKVLVAHGKCQSIERCRDTVYFKGDAIRQGLKFYTYGVTGKEALQEIVAVFTGMILDFPEIKSWRFTAYKLPRSEASNSVILNVEIRR